MGWYWHLVERDLQSRGYDAIAVDLAARWSRLAFPRTPTRSWTLFNGRNDVALIAQSMGAFTAPLVWQRVATRLVVFVNAMVPQPGETPGEWWKNVGVRAGQDCGSREAAGTALRFDLATYFPARCPCRTAAEDLESTMPLPNWTSDSMTDCDLRHLAPDSDPRRRRP